ncbi:NAD-dependent deacylase [Geobacillus proteiniphilus]|uniref:NAD-dependent protein deacetylase n=1 Tax=Geobacillus proteiniphilus TaxID=860353 RepID=A0A1Q5SPU3_9BACL|nr:NAD-dependent deacylase [Geobacillus proteiniphilus]OKO89943.1 NAD-dependent protein deacetylase of SIR2 family [Geobacillus proteiniphilus]WMJ15177.1 NAD-dependent deacylase [Geobacillus proteiniphilus]
MSIASWLAASRRTVVLTGAGMSTESGLPDFRSPRTGLWARFNPSELATIDALYHRRESFVEFYQYRIRTLQQCQPHDGHRLLADWERRGIVQTIVTQNVDGFHQEAGSRRVIELHGSLRTVHCQQCGQQKPSFAYLHGVLTCECGGVLRPSVVLFGEPLPEKTIDQAWEAARQADLFVVLGSSLQVSPANQLPLVAKRSGAKLVIINWEPTELDDLADAVIHQRKIGEVLNELNEQLAEVDQ